MLNLKTNVTKMPYLTSNELKSIKIFLENIDNFDNYQHEYTIINFRGDYIHIEDELRREYILKKQNGKYIELMRTNKKVIIISSPTKTQKKDSKKRKTKYKTKKGKIVSRNVQSILIGAVALGTIILGATKITNSADNKYPEITMETIDNNDSNNILSESFKIELENLTNVEVEQSELEKNPSQYQHETIELNYEVSQSQRMNKREKVEKEYGYFLEEYSKRWGIPTGLFSAVITQECDDENTINPGQLTRNICGEKFLIPIIQKNATDTQEVDKIYVVRDEPNRANFKKDDDYRSELKKYQEQLIESKKLAQEGYEIINYENLIKPENWQENIRISAVYLAHCNYKCHNNPVLGMRAYNGGYSSIRSSSIDQVMKGNAGSEKSDLLYNYHVYRFLKSEEACGLTFIQRPFPENWDSMSSSERRQYLEEGIKDAPFLTTTITLPKFKECENEKEAGHHL